MNSAVESIRVLHVDDDLDLVELAAEMLEREDERLAVDTATSASDGLNRLTDTDYDCIVSDYDMPRQDGIDFLEAVRERHPDLPFILYTGKGTEAIASEAITAGVTDYLQKESGTDQYTVLANRVTNAIEQYRSTQRAAQLERLRRVVKDANKALLRAETRSEIEKRICEVISDADPYLFAWFGKHEPDAQTVEPRATTGIEEGYLDAIEITTDEQATAQGPTGQAVRTQEIVVEQEIAESPEYVPWREAALDRGYQSSAAIPITRDNSVLGVLNVYADHPHAFDDEEQELLADLATDTGQALDRIKLTDRLQLFNAAVEAAGHSIYVTDTEGTIEYVNPAFEVITGYTDEEAVGRNPRILQSGEHDQAFYEELWDTILAGDVWQSELINTTKSGDRYVIDQTIAPVRHEDDAIKHFVAVNSDITERKQREHRFAAVFNNTFQFTGLLEPDGTFIEANETALEFGGLQREEVVGKHLAETGWIREENRERVREAVERAREGEFDRFEMEINGSDGPAVIDFSLKPMTNEYGEIELLIPEGRDITERKSRQRDLEQTNSVIKTIVNNLPMGVLVEDTEREVLMANDQLGETLGVPLDSDDLVGRDCATAAEELQGLFTDPEGFRDGIREAIGQREPVHHEELRLADGRMLEREYVPYTLPEGAASMWLYRDVTERKERERQLQRERDRLDEFAGVVSHDLRNPLNVAKGRLDLAMEDCASEHLGPVARSHERMESIIDDVLSLARAGEVVGEMEPVELADLVGACWQTVETASAELVVETETTIQADATRLQQLFENLVRNAVEHGGEDVTITVGDLPDGFYVEDDGQGIPADERGSIFDTGYSTAADGTGLGLSIVREVAEAHGWEIEVTESESGGARFEATGV